MATNWTKVSKATNTGWTKIATPSNELTIAAGQPIGLLLALTNPSITTIVSGWTKVLKATGTVWTKITKAT